MSWTDERIALLKKMWKEGKSAAEIAKVLAKGVTRNAVIGKAHRMGLSGRPSPIKKPAAPAKKEAVKKEPAAKDVKKSASSLASSKAPAAKNPLLNREVDELKKIEREAVPLGGGVALIDLTERMCKWPIGDPREPDFTFCGRGIRPGTPYCPEHAAAAYQSSSRRGAAAAAAAANQGKEVVEDEEEVVVEDADDAADEVADDSEVA